MSAPAATEIMRRLATDLLYYGERCLMIRPKEGPPIRLKWNKAQRFVHAKLEEQKKRTGKVRAIILKGRQQGISTYIQARFFHRVVTTFGTTAFILTHSDDATKNLFGMARRFLDNLDAELKPHTDKESTTELHFDALDSGYSVSTAGSKGAGRSFTIKLFHGSEVAFWKNDTEHEAGVMQAIPDAEGSESILESTGYGVGNVFHKRWQAAEAGQSEYIAIFVPWWWSSEYEAKVPASFELSEEEIDYKEQHGLTLAQMAWRRNKIADFGGDISKFRQEYPATPLEAFEESGHESFIPGALITRARRAKDVQAVGPKVLTLDPARYGDDRAPITFRQGRVVHWQRVYQKKSTMQLVGYLHNAIQEIKPDVVFVDVIGLGAGIVDRLQEMDPDECGGMDYSELVVPVNYAEKADDAERYVNKRAECNAKAKQWLEAPPVKLPDDDALQADAVACGYSYDSHGRLQIEEKKAVKKKGKRSPDLWDGITLSFAQPVKRRKAKSDDTGSETARGPNSWMRG